MDLRGSKVSLRRSAAYNELLAASEGLQILQFTTETLHTSGGKIGSGGSNSLRLTVTNVASASSDCDPSRSTSLGFGSPTIPRSYSGTLSAQLNSTTGVGGLIVAKEDGSCSSTSSKNPADMQNPIVSARNFIRSQQSRRRDQGGRLQVLSLAATGRYHIHTEESTAWKKMLNTSAVEEFLFVVRNLENEETKARKAVGAEFEAFSTFAFSNEPTWREAALGAQIQREQLHLVESQDRERRAKQQQLEAAAHREAEVQQAQLLSDKSQWWLEQAGREKELWFQEDHEDWFTLATLQYDEILCALQRDRASQEERLRQASANPAYTSSGYPYATLSSAGSGCINNLQSPPTMQHQHSGSYSTAHGTVQGSDGMVVRPSRFASGLLTGGTRGRGSMPVGGFVPPNPNSTGNHFGSGGAPAPFTGGGLVAPANHNHNYGTGSAYGGAALPSFVPTGTGPSSAATPYYNPQPRVGAYPNTTFTNPAASPDNRRR